MVVTMRNDALGQQTDCGGGAYRTKSTVLSCCNLPGSVLDGVYSRMTSQLDLLNVSTGVHCVGVCKVATPLILSVDEKVNIGSFLRPEDNLQRSAFLLLSNSRV